MGQASTDINELLPATECGRICAVAAESQRDLQECAAAYCDLFSGGAFDPALFSTVAFLNTFCSPRLTADQLRIANRVTLWCFGLDWLIDYLVKSRNEVQDIVQRCLAVADGAPPSSDDHLTRFLADIRNEMTTVPAFTALRSIWRDQLHRTLNAMAREWEWKSARTADSEVALPTFEEYLRNADNLCFCFVYVSHWIFTSERNPIEHIDELRAAGWEAQRVIRLLNDLGTYHRDLSWGDLNALMLGVTRTDVTQRIAVLVNRCQELLRPLSANHSELTVFLERQIGFNTGFYGITDYWGKP